MPVRTAEIFHRQSSHQKILQNAVLYHLDARSGTAFVVVAIKARQLCAAESMQRGIVGHAEELGQDFFVHLFSKSLAFVAAPLALSFNAMAEHFMKKNGRGAAGEQRGTTIRFGKRRGVQRAQVVGHFLRARCHFGFRGKLCRIGKLESLDAHQLHAIVGAGFGLDHDAEDGIGGDDLCAFGRDQVIVALLGIKKNQGLFDLRIPAEGSGIAAGEFFPSLLVGKRGRRSLIRVSGWLLLREVGRIVFVLGADGGLGLNVGVGLARLAVLLIGQLPKHAGDGVGVVPLRKFAGGNTGEAFLVVRVIKSGSADAHADVRGTVAGAGRGEDATLGAEDDQRFAVGHVVAGEIGGGVLLGKLGPAAMQLLFHGGEEEIVGRLSVDRLLGVQRFLTKDGSQ